ncbi:unnamed protein product, partial [Musa hybrid cultivar]
ELIGCSFRGVPWRPWHRTPAPPRPGNACSHAARPLCASGGGGEGKTLAHMTSPCAPLMAAQHPLPPMGFGLSAEDKSKPALLPKKRIGL